MRNGVLALAVLLTATPAFAQLGGFGSKISKAKEIGDKVADLRVSEADERKIGDVVSEKVRAEFGVYQNAAVTKYVTLVGTLLAQASERPSLKWEFIVLDTDGVNAFAAPGGIVHITRGALGMIKSEAELAGVLGHEVEHVAQKHTVKAIEQSKKIKLGTDVAAGSREWVNTIADSVYDDLVENGFDRAQENDADSKGIVLANKVGYNPSGLGTFLTKLMERNKGETEHNGLFASHPDTESRIDKLGKQIKADRLTASAMVAPRYGSTITFDVKPLAEVAAVASGTKGVAGGSGKPAETEAKKEQPKKKGFGLPSMTLSNGKQAETTQANASAGGRAVGNPDRKAKGGDNPNKIAVTVTTAELTAFKNGIA